MAAGQSTTVFAPFDLLEIHLWARTGCKNENGQFKCDTGNCGPWIECAWDHVSRVAEKPFTLTKFVINTGDGVDHYEVSLEDGYNLPVSISALQPTDEQLDDHWCHDTACTQDLNEFCPEELEHTNSDGDVVGCRSACDKFNTDAYCCRGNYNSMGACDSATLWSVDYATVFKQACPTAFAYQYDTKAKVYNCRNSAYEITFC